VKDGRVQAWGHPDRAGEKEMRMVMLAICYCPSICKGLSLHLCQVVTAPALSPFPVGAALRCEGALTGKLSVRSKGYFLHKINSPLIARTCMEMHQSRRRFWLYQPAFHEFLTFVIAHG
jgi:hypothetical protein